MPSQLTHLLIAQRALDHCGAWQCADWSPAMWAAFNLGAQGPDVFYHNHRSMPSGLHFGALAHRFGYGTSLATMAALTKPHAQSRLGISCAYVLGLATHAAIDRVVHPYVVYFSGWMNPREPETRVYRFCHSFFERVLDVLLLSKWQRLNIDAFDQTALIPDSVIHDSSSSAYFEDDFAKIINVLALGLCAAYPRSAGLDLFLSARIGNALKDSCGYYQWTNPFINKDLSIQTECKKSNTEAGVRIIAVLYPRTCINAYDFANAGHALWEHPAGDGRQYTSSFYDLADDACAAASSALTCVHDFWTGRLRESSLADAIGNGGLSVCSIEGERTAPKIARPFPLKAAMEAELTWRCGLGVHVDPSAMGTLA